MCLAIPGEILEVYERHGLQFASVRFGGTNREVCLEYQKDAKRGDFVLVHVGFAIARVDPEAAARTWDTLRELGETAELETP
jgi:hydrogenase expression/formation protein HypC